MRKHLQSLSNDDESSQSSLLERLKGVGFRDVEGTAARLKSLSGTGNSAECLARLLRSVTDMAEVDELLVDFERFVQRSGDRSELYQFLLDHPRPRNADQAVRRQPVFDRNAVAKPERTEATHPASTAGGSEKPAGICSGGDGSGGE